MGAILERGALLHKRYRIIDILGQGGMGSVYRAVDENLGVDVAVKENLFFTDEYARQFRLEAVILANLRHPNLPRVTDHFVIEGQGQYLIMDYIEGEDLRQRMEQNRPISEEEAILVGAAMCDALQYLHTRKPSIIHRDLKPGNVRITPDGRIYLVDFGLAKLVNGSQATTSGARAMTPGYSPPEQYGTARTDARTDIYSLGATLYATLSGIIPEDGLARAMDNIKLTPLRKRNPKITRKLTATIEKAMAVRPEERFQTAEEFKQALLTSNIKTQQLDGEPASESTLKSPGSEENKNLMDELTGEGKAAPFSLTTLGRFWKDDKIRRWMIVAASLVILLGLAITLFWSPITKAFQSQIPAGTLEPVSGDPGSGSLLTSITPTSTVIPAIMPSPSPTPLDKDIYQIAFASDDPGMPQISLINPDGSNRYTITNIPEGACQPAWSPDGMQLVFVSPCPGRQEEYPRAKLYTMNADGSDITRLPTNGGGDFDPDWSPDGTRIAFTSLHDGSRQIYVLTLADGSITPITSIDEATYPVWSSQPVWSADGKQIVYTGFSSYTNAPQIWTMDGSGDNKKYLILRGPLVWDFLPAWSPDGTTVIFSETKGPQELGWLMRFAYLSNAAAVRLRAATTGTHARFSRDGVWITYENVDIENLHRTDYDIYSMRADGSGAINRLTETRSQDFDAAWRPVITP